jgi:hypothetical protein
VDGVEVIKNIIEYKGDKEYTLEELMSEINYKIKDYGYQLLSLDPNNVKLITFTPDAKIDVFLLIYIYLLLLFRVLFLCIIN